MTRKSYGAEKITVSFDLGRCIHSAECIRVLPEVFDTEKRPWIRPDKAEPDAVVEVVTRCPTGALRFERRDGSPEETAPEENRIAVGENGPLYVRGDIEIKDSLGNTLLEESRVALCRCGESRNKPFCDNTHKEVNFRHHGSLGKNRLSDDQDPDRRGLRIVPSVNGPLLLRGEVEILDARGETSYRGTRAALCRCGHSGNKPFCDGSHARTGWRDDR